MNSNFVPRFVCLSGRDCSGKLVSYSIKCRVKVDVLTAPLSAFVRALKLLHGFSDLRYEAIPARHDTLEASAFLPVLLSFATGLYIDARHVAHVVFVRAL